MNTDRVITEKQRLTALFFDYGISQSRLDALAPVIDNVAWMRVKLDDTREDIKDAKVVIATEKKLKKNPLFEGYEALFKAYMNGLNALLDVLPEETAVAQAAEVDKPKTVLELVREKHKKEA